jgi:hypothetical protein
MGARSAVCGLWMIAFVVRPEPGLEVGGTVGGGRYKVVGCAETSPTYYSETSYAGNVRYRTGSGLTVAADGSGSTGNVRSGPGGPREGFSFAGRLGWHFQYGGGEAGVGWLRRQSTGLGGGVELPGPDKTTVYPSATLWLGLPEIHAFGTLMANRYAVDQGDLTVGIGHSSRFLNASIGAGAQGIALDAEAKLTRYVSPTVSVRWQNDSMWNVAAGLTFRWDPGAGTPQQQSW